MAARLASDEHSIEREYDTVQKQQQPYTNDKIKTSYSISSRFCNKNLFRPFFTFL